MMGGPLPEGANQRVDAQTFRRVVRFFRPYWKRVLLTVIAILVTAGLGLINPSLNASSLKAVPADKVRQASGIANFMRQLGGAFGINLIVAYFEIRTHFHAEALTATQDWGVGVGVGGLVGLVGAHRGSPRPSGRDKIMASAWRPSHQVNPSTLRSEMADSIRPRAWIRPSREGAEHVIRTEGTTPLAWCPRS